MLNELGLTLYEQQAEFVFADEQAVCLFAGSGAGMTHGGCVRALLAACGEIGGAHLPIPNTGLITSPNYLMLKETALKTFLKIAHPLIAHFSKVDMVATMTNGSEVLFRSADNPAGWENENLLWWFGDDAGFYPAHVRDSVLKRLSQYDERGWWWLTTSGPEKPHENDWVKAQFIDNPQPEQRVFRIPTWRNPFLSAENLTLFARLYGEDFKDEGSPVYPPFNVYEQDNGR